MDCPDCGEIYNNSYGRKRCDDCNARVRKERNAVYRANTREARKVYDQKRSIEKKEEISAYHKKHYQENKESIKTYAKTYAKNNRSKVNAYKKKMYNTNPNFRMRQIISKRLKRVLKSIRLKKSTKTMDLLGCNIDDFTLWIEWQFTDEMHWKNHGSVWHVDHVIPCALFDQSDKDEQEKCWHWSNMQPLLGPENLSKGDKTSIGEQQNQINKIKKFINDYNEDISDDMYLLEYDRFVYVGVKIDNSVLSHTEQSDDGSGENSEVEEKSEL